MADELVLLGAAALLLLSVIVSGAWSRLGIPSLLLFLVIGMLAGSEGPGGIAFDDAEAAQALGVVALVFILFSGGLDTDWKMVRPVLKEGLGLSTAGVFLTAVIVGGFAHLVLGFTLVEGMLLGGIVSSTDAAAVFSIFRSLGARLRGRLTYLLEFESGSNDPMAVFLTVAMLQLIMSPESSPLGLAGFFVRQMLFGGVAGYLFGRLTALLLNRIRLDHDGLYPVMTLGMVLFCYAATAAAGGNGFLAVYIAGIVVGNTRTVHHESVSRFHDGIAWLMQISMFLALGLLVFPSELSGVVGEGLAISAVLILVARPIGVFLTLLPMRVPVRECMLVSWVGLRGAVPIILATFPLLAGVPQADYIFNMVFFIVLTSALVQGTTLIRVARWLGLDEPTAPPAPAEPHQAPSHEILDVQLGKDCAATGRRIVDLDLPPDLILALVRRGDRAMIPTGSTKFEIGDAVMLVGREDTIREAMALFGEPGARGERDGSTAAAEFEPPASPPGVA